MNVYKVHPDAIVPEYGTNWAVGADLAICEPSIIYPGEAARLRTGLVFEVPLNMAMLIVPRSSTYRKHKLTMPHSMGVIDPDYRGAEDEVLIQVINHNEDEVSISAGTRIAQALFVPITRPSFNLSEDHPQAITRGGFGSTG